MLSRPALRNFKLKCKWILTLTSTIYSTTIYNLNTQSNWFKHNIGTRNEFYLSFTSPTRIRGSAFKIGDNENSNGFSKTHFPLTRSAKRTLWEFGHGEPGEGQVSVSFYSKGWWGKGWDTPYQDQDHKIITATQCFWVANGLTTASTNHLQEYIFSSDLGAQERLMYVCLFVRSSGSNLSSWGGNTSSCLKSQFFI